MSVISVLFDDHDIDGISTKKHIFNEMKQNIITGGDNNL